MDRRQPDRPMPQPDRRKGGRPPAEEPLRRISTRLPERDLDRLITFSERCGQPVSETIRQILILSLPK
jgi:hypothetical protein